MLLLKDVALELQQILNDQQELSFLVTDSVQNWYNYDIKDADGKKYIPTVVTKLPTPIMVEYYTTRALEYSISLKGLADHRNAVEELIKNKESLIVDGYEWKLSNFIVNDITTKEDVREFYATFRLTIFVQTFITGNDVEVTVGGSKINVVGINGAFDKMLIPNIPYNMGDNLTATGSEFAITMVLDTNTADIFGAITDNTYNKVYLIKLDFKAVEIEFNAVLSGGGINAIVNNQPITFNATFIKALPRNIITINGASVPVIGFTPQVSVEPAPRQYDKTIKNKASSVTYAYQLQLINDGSAAANALIQEIHNHNNTKFTLSFDGKSRDCIVLNGTVPSAEHPNAIISVTLGDGYFD